MVARIGLADVVASDRTPIEVGSAGLGSRTPVCKDQAERTAPALGVVSWPALLLDLMECIPRQDHLQRQIHPHQSHLDLSYRRAWRAGICTLEDDACGCRFPRLTTSSNALSPQETPWPN